MIFIISIAFILLEQKTNLNHTKHFIQEKYFCNTVIPSGHIKILELNQYYKIDKAPFIIYADFECLIKKTDGRKTNPENSLTEKLDKHIPSGFSMSIISSFKSLENKHDVFRGTRLHEKVLRLFIIARNRDTLFGCRKGSRGTNDLFYIDRAVFKEVKSRNKNLAMTRIDYKRAYNMVPHSLITEYLDLFRVAENIESLLVNSTENWKLMECSGNSELGEVEIRGRIFQRDSFPP